MRRGHRRRTRPALIRRALIGPALLTATIWGSCAPAAHALSFATNPDLPNLPALTLNGRAQTLTATMLNFAVSLGILDVSGFNITAAGDSSGGHSAVFKVYCPGPGACGTDPVGYVAGGATLPSDSLTF